MLSTKAILLFLCKAIIVSVLFFLPGVNSDKLYGNFYRAACAKYLSKIGTNGIVRFTASQQASTTQIAIWNQTQVNPDGSVTAATAEINTRYRGYMPTIFLISLILASPVPWRRKIITGLLGLILITAFILFKQWLGLLNVCLEHPAMHLFEPANTSLFEFFVRVFLKSTSTILYLTVALWVVLTFRLKDYQEWKKKLHQEPK